MLKKAFVLFFCLIAIASCNLNLGEETVTGSVRIMLPSGNKALPTEADVARYEVTLSSVVNNYENVKAGAPGEEIVFTSLKPGMYMIDVEAFNAASLLIFTGEETVLVEPGKTKQVVVNLQYAPGAITVGFTFPEPFVGNIVKPAAPFSSNSTADVVTACLTNGNIFVAYREVNTGYFIIFDQNGDIVNPASQFAATALNIETLALRDGRVLLAYNNSNSARFLILDDTGDVSVPETIFKESSYFTGSSVSASQLGNGNIILSYVFEERDIMSFPPYDSYAELAVIDNSGTVVRQAARVTESSSVMSVDAITLADGKALIAYVYDSNAAFIVIDGIGNVVSAETAIASADQGEIKASLLQNGNVFFMYGKTNATNNGYDAKYIITQPDGSVAVGESFLFNEPIIGGECIRLNYGSILVFSRANEYKGRYMVIGEDGTEEMPLTIYGDLAEAPGVSLCENGNVVIAYPNPANGWKGTLEIRN